MNILLIDNFDSFSYNLVDEFEKRKCRVIVYRNNIGMNIIEAAIKSFRPSLIVISPGPSNPKNAGISEEIIRKFHKEIPIFGVCLGHQCIVEVFGGKVGPADEIVHGKAASIEHDGKTIYAGIENPFKAGRYHSLAGIKIPSCLEISAKAKDIVMGARHRKYFIEGVQFHPESILTPAGGAIIENLIKMIKNERQTG